VARVFLDPSRKVANMLASRRVTDLEGKKSASEIPQTIEQMAATENYHDIFMEEQRYNQMEYTLKVDFATSIAHPSSSLSHPLFIIILSYI